jgi:hypothetical protein
MVLTGGDLENMSDIQRKEPGERQRELRRLYDAWEGWRFGIVSEVLGRDADGAITRVSLFLYDPKTASIQMTAGYTIPEFNDFAVSELEPHSDATDLGYAVFPRLG